MDRAPHRAERGPRGIVGRLDLRLVGQIRTARAQFLLDYNGNPDVPMSWRFDKVRAVLGPIDDVRLKA